MQKKHVSMKIKIKGKNKVNLNQNSIKNIAIDTEQDSKKHICAFILYERGKTGGL